MIGTVLRWFGWQDVRRRRLRQRVRERRVRAALAKEARLGLRFILVVRLVVLLTIALWVAFVVDWERARFYLSGIAGFVAVGGAAAFFAWNARRSLLWIALLLTVDIALLTTAALTETSLFGAGFPVQMQLRFFSFLYLFLFVAAAVLSQSPPVVLWTGFAGAILWGLNSLRIVLRPETVLTSANQIASSGLSVEERLRIILGPTHVSLTVWQSQTMLLLVTTVVLAAATWRSRALVLAQARAEAARSQLARFFSPNVVERLAGGAASLDRARLQPVAILFVDLVDFARLAERLPPAATLDVLRNFHRRMARAVFAAQGTLDKYVGDCVMATFGTPDATGDESTRALLCACAMLDELERWNLKRHARGAGTLAVGIGVHWGPVIVGNVGDEQRLEYTVVGDPVNIAARLERLTRELGVSLAASGELLVRARAEGPVGEALAGRFVSGGTRQLRNRLDPTELWLYPASPPSASGSLGGRG